MQDSSIIFSHEVYVETPLIQKSKEFVFNHFNRQADQKGVVFHTLKTTTDFVKILQKISLGNKIDQKDNEHLTIAGWFAMTGHIVNYDTAEESAKSTFHDFANGNNLSQQDIEQINRYVSIYFGAHAETLNEQIVSDARLILLFGEGYKVNQSLVEYETELQTGVQHSSVTIEQERLKRLLNARLKTPYALEQYASQIDQNTLSARKRVAKNNAISVDSSERQLYEGIEEGVPSRGIQSYFRSIYRVHINLSAIADNKANIMISVNAILISVLISLLSYQNITQTNPKILFPVLAFIVTGLTSLIFAVLSARPKVTYPNKDVVDRKVMKRNMIFFGSYVHMQLDEYEDLMDEVFRDGKLIYGNMIRDMYFLGKVLDKKYQFLTISYNIFMVGFAITVISFLVLLFHPNL